VCAASRAAVKLRHYEFVVAERLGGGEPAAGAMRAPSAGITRIKLFDVMAQISLFVKLKLAKCASIVIAGLVPAISIRDDGPKPGHDTPRGPPTANHPAHKARITIKFHCSLQ
jgi:hypothetical protein